MKKALTVVSIITVLLSSFTIYAASIEVNSADDDPTGGNTFCTLREAINNANDDSDTTAGDCTSGSGTDTIIFSNDFTITLSTTLPQITTTIIIDGTGHTTTVAGDNSSKCFDVEASGDLTINLLTIVNGNGGPTGGGIDNDGTLTVTDSTISNSVAGSGGGIYNTGTLTVTNSTISDNSTNTANDGGGIYNTGIILNITNSTISGNTATNSVGGGIYNDGLILSITNSTISGNTADTDFGGGIFNDNGTITSISNSTFSGNSAISGAGIYNDTAGEVTNIVNSTFSGNTATTSGGGIFNNNSITIIANSTFSGNSANSGAGIYNNTGEITSIANTIIAYNTNNNCFGTAPSNSSKLLTDSTGCDSWGGDNTLLPDHLGPLASNGGPTQTMALLLSAPTNPAIDTGDTTTCSGSLVLGLDQRGVTRPQGPACDIGAFEQEPEAYKFPWTMFTPATTGMGKQL